MDWLQGVFSAWFTFQGKLETNASCEDGTGYVGLVLSTPAHVSDEHLKRG